MRKLIFGIMLLTILNVIAFIYLYRLTINRKPFIFHPSEKTFLYQKKKIILDDTSDFVFDDYFHVLSNANYLYRYDFNDDRLRIRLGDDDYFFPYEISEPQIEVVERIVEKTVVKEVYVNGNDNVPINYPEERKEEAAEVEEAYFSLLSDHCSFANGTDMHEIIAVIGNHISTNKRVTVDYSELNPYESGYYSVFFLTDDGKYEMTVEIK